MAMTWRTMCVSWLVCCHSLGCLEEVEGFDETRAMEPLCGRSIDWDLDGLGDDYEYYGYDAAGHLTTVLRDVDRDGWAEVHTERRFDLDGRLEREDEDANADGVVDRSRHYEYSAHGVLEAMIEDDDMDLRPDYVIGYVHDAAGFVVTEVHRWTSPEDGELIRHEYDRFNRIVQSRGSGRREGGPWLQTYTYTSRGWLSHDERTTDQGIVHSNDYRYDRFGRLVTQETRGPDGELRSRQEWRFAGHSSPIQAEVDRTGDAVLDYRIRYDYGRCGRPWIPGVDGAVDGRNGQADSSMPGESPRTAAPSGEGEGEAQGSPQVEALVDRVWADHGYWDPLEGRYLHDTCPVGKECLTWLLMLNGDGTYRALVLTHQPGAVGDLEAVACQSGTWMLDPETLVTIDDSTHTDTHWHWRLVGETFIVSPFSFEHSGAERSAFDGLSEQACHGG